jgi:hypothetical protein
MAHKHSAHFDTGAELNAISKRLVEHLLKFCEDEGHQYKELEHKEYKTVCGESRKIYGVLKTRWMFSKRRFFNVYRDIELAVIDLPEDRHQIIIGRDVINKLAKLNDSGLPVLLTFYRIPPKSKMTSK